MNYSVALTEVQNSILKDHLLRERSQEDLCFALYNISKGKNRTSAVIVKIILPRKGDRNLHGNVSFNSDYFDRVMKMALQENCGILFMHSHPSNGWQDMSRDDIAAETMLSPRVKGITGLPLVGMTIGQDGIWSARFWIKQAPKKYKRIWCNSVRIVGNSLIVQHNDQILKPIIHSEEFVRTVSAWGIKKQNMLSELHVGIVGLGSVGSIIAEGLLKTGIRQITLIDFDLVELKNLDRLQGIGKNDIGKLKITVVEARLKKQKLIKNLKIVSVPYSIIEKEGYLHALDCDVIFCCVDRPWPRYVLNALSYANLIPVIDGGIEASINKKLDNLGYARWKTHTAGSGRRCLNCLGQYTMADVSLERSGMLDNPSYIKNLPPKHFINRGENVFAFSMGTSAMEMQQFLSLVLQPRGQYYGAKEFDFNSGNIDFKFPYVCEEYCDIKKIIEGQADKVNGSYIEVHSQAENARKLVLKSKESLIAKFNNFFL